MLDQLIFTNTSINNVLIHLKENPLLGFTSKQSRRIQLLWTALMTSTERDTALVPSLAVFNYSTPLAKLTLFY